MDKWERKGKENRTKRKRNSFKKSRIVVTWVDDVVGFLVERCFNVNDVQIKRQLMKRTDFLQPFFSGCCVLSWLESFAVVDCQFFSRIFFWFNWKILVVAVVVACHLFGCRLILFSTLRLFPLSLLFGPSSMCLSSSSFLFYLTSFLFILSFLLSCRVSCASIVSFTPSVRPSLSLSLSLASFQLRRECLIWQPSGSESWRANQIVKIIGSKLCLAPGLLRQEPSQLTSVADLQLAIACRLNDALLIRRHWLLLLLFL